MVSVVIPLYNKEKYIVDTLNSVLGQTYTNFEVIVVNDGSTDASLQELKAFNDPRLNVYTIVHSGVSAARNFGVKKSNFNWISFLDADDWWDSNFLKEMMSLQMQFPENRIFASGRTHIYGNGKTWRYANNEISNDGEIKVINYFKVIRNHLPPINSSNAILMKEELIKIGGFNELQKKHEDHDLWIRLSINNKIVYCNKNLSFYRNTDSNSASKQYYTPKDFISYLETLRAVKTKLKEKNASYFQKYCNRFIFYTFIKYREHYSVKEENDVLTHIKLIISYRLFLFLKFVMRFPLKKMYPFFKRLK